jgi:hypothetical protein
LVDHKEVLAEMMMKASVVVAEALQEAVEVAAVEALQEVAEPELIQPLQAISNSSAGLTVIPSLD